MKYLYTICFIFLVLTKMNGQRYREFSTDRSYITKRPELTWKDTDGGLAFLKKELFIKLDFQMDSFSVDTMKNELFYENLSKSVASETYRKSFETAFNEEFGGKIGFNYSLVSSNYNYVIKITPVKFYIIQGPCFDPYLGPNGKVREFASDFLFGDYIFEICEKNSGKPLYKMEARQMMNPIPKYSKCNPKKYNSDFNTNVTLNFSTMGKYAAKHMRKLFKK